VLLEGVPGLAKTLTVRTLATVLGGSFSRIQFTPDLVPADLVGTRIWQPGDGSFRTELGPVFANLLLAEGAQRQQRDGGTRHGVDLRAPQADAVPSSPPKPPNHRHGQAGRHHRRLQRRRSRTHGLAARGTGPQRPARVRAPGRRRVPWRRRPRRWCGQSAIEQWVQAHGKAVTGVSTTGGTLYRVSA
jgi:ATPase family associated with various cellular activities (AAA)